MFSHTGSMKFALFLLCCMGIMLSSHMLTAQPQQREVRKIIMELQDLSRRLLEDYKKEEKGVPESNNYTLPCFTSDSQTPHNIDSSAILSYFQVIRPLIYKNITSEIIEQLEKLKFRDTPEINVFVPTDSFERKRFILTIFQQFSKCMNQTLAQ